MTRVGDFGVTPEQLPGGATLLNVEGDLDMSTTPKLEEKLVDAGFEQRVVIDLTRCTFVDSSAVRVLVAAARDSEAAGGTLALVASDPGLLRVLEISSVKTIVPVYPQLDAAL